MKKKREYELSEEFNRSCANPIEISMGKAVYQQLSGDSILKGKLEKITRKASRTSGLDIPEIALTENPAPNSYSISFFNVQVAKGKIYPGFYVVRDYDETLRALPGHRGFDPVWGAPYQCLWVNERDCGRVSDLGYQALTVEGLIVQHLEFILQVYLGEFIDPDGFREILMEIESSHPELIHKVLKKMNVPTLFGMVKNLVNEGISFNHLTTFLYHIAESDGVGKEERTATESLRTLLNHEICYPIAPEKVIHCIVMSIPLQMYFALRSARISRRNGWGRFLVRELRRIFKKSVSKDLTPALLCIPEIRPLVSSLVRNFFPDTIILKTGEIPPDHEVSIVDIIEPPLWKIIPSLVLPYITADLKYLGFIWKSTDTYMEIIDKAEEEFIMGRLNTSIQNRLKEDHSGFSEQDSRSLPALPPPTCGELIPGQKAAIFLLGSPPYYVKEVLSRLEPRDINSLGKEMAKLAKFSHNYRDQILKEYPELDHKCCDFDEAAKFVRASLNGENYKPQTKTVKKLALLLTSLSGKTGELVTSAILPRLPKDTLETLIVEINNFRFAVTTELKAQIIEEFMMFYRNGRYPQTLFTPPFFQRELQRLGLTYPKEFAYALQTLWLNMENIINRFNYWAGQDPCYAAIWINRFFIYSGNSKTNFRMLEKATWLIHSISTEISSGILRNLKIFSKVLSQKERLKYLTMSQSQQNEIISQFLLHFYSLYYSKISQKYEGKN